MIVITCASGKQASSFIPHLISSSTGPLRLVVNSASSQSRLEAEYPSASVVCADLTQPSDCQRVVKDAVTIYLILPPFHHAETEIGKNLVEAAVTESKRLDSAFKHFIFSSVIQTQLRKLLNHDVKRYVEEYLMESGLNYTILKPTTFLDNFRPALKGLVKQVTEDGKKELEFNAPWDANVLFSEIALRDMGDVSFKVITEREKHFFASYDLVSTMPQPWSRKVYILAEKLGCKITVGALPVQQVTPVFMKNAVGSRADDAHRVTFDTAERMILYYNRHGIIGNPSVLEMLIGRKATTTEEWVEAQIAEARQSS
ncbi:hypothetical protein H2198_007207 [Neophaeococcomyces mojaviensis]|uniref:Uncharacterized protein n=1 Tax=Neophaeococcomyces mojaviensis TaxID=3383035 RepID=A0ACC3A0N7_9EURO|nr:hypothetical protein H2198_007207 [Knufia sp. JES_112]